MTRHEGSDGRTLLVGVGYFGDECGAGGGDEAALSWHGGGDEVALDDEAAARAAAGAAPPVPPSRAAARAATARLKRLLDETDATSAVATQASTYPLTHSLACSLTHLPTALARLLARSPTHSLATQAIVRDGASELAAEAAEALCWEETALPPQLADALGKHTRMHLQAFG